jgi:hypothetical protein
VLRLPPSRTVPQLPACEGVLCYHSKDGFATGVFETCSFVGCTDYGYATCVNRSKMNIYRLPVRGTTLGRTGASLLCNSMRWRSPAKDPLR